MVPYLLKSGAWPVGRLDGDFLVTSALTYFLLGRALSLVVVRPQVQCENVWAGAPTHSLYLCYAISATRPPPDIIFAQFQCMLLEVHRYLSCIVIFKFRGRRSAIFVVEAAASLPNNPGKRAGRSPPPCPVGFWEGSGRFDHNKRRVPAPEF